MTETIEHFTGQHRFLSNFYYSPVSVTWGTNMLVAPTVEHAYQASKTHVLEEFMRVLKAKTPGQAKRLGQRVSIHPGWEQIKLSVMEGLLRQKFSSPLLRRLLIETGTAKLIEGNHWGDTFWGQVDGEGENHLGKLLMKIRAGL